MTFSIDSTPAEGANKSITRADQFPKDMPSTGPHPLVFSATADEYFRIWIVNLFLTIITLGIYSAWAKVRTKRYFCNNTVLFDRPFDYVADPLAILKGRLIAFSIFAVYLVSAGLFPAMEILFWIIFAPLVPWIVVRALKFNARNTSYRNLRFDFDGGYREALVTFIILPLAGFITLGLAYPFMIYRQRQFVVNHSRFGTTPFVFGASAMDYYKVFIKVIGILLVSAALASIATAFSGTSADWLSDANPSINKENLASIMIMFACISLGYLVVFAYMQTALPNLAWSNTQIADNHFDSDLKTGKTLWIHISNIGAIICSFGLLIPWASIRMARYRIENLALSMHQSMDGFLAGEQKHANATGEEFGDFFDVEIAL